MSSFPFESLTIAKFRPFRRLRVPKAGRVNLIVGKNNSGKTSLLEAIQILATMGSAKVLNQQLEARDEFPDAEESPDESRYLTLFHGRPSRFEAGVECGFTGGDASVTVVCQWVREKQGDIATLLIQGSRSGRSVQSIVGLNGGTQKAGDPESDAWPCVFVNASGMGKDALGKMWDTIALSDQESDAIRALQIMSPEIERLSFVGERGARRKPMVRISGSGRRVTLGSFGDGVNRMLALSLALANAKDGVLLVDEIENGIHHSVQQRIWTFLLEAARQLNVQVFATTHSWDCLSAFQQACGRDAGAEGVVIRLERSGDDITATVFDERELDIAARESIEIR